MIIRLLIILLVALLPSLSWAACDCASTDQSNPCTGTAVSVTVTAGTPNSGTAYDGVYNWTFNSGGGAARCGQFANGDYWAAPAAGQSTVTVTALTTTSPGEIRADADPNTEDMGLLGVTVGYGNYDATENIVPNLPISYSGINSLVAGIIRNQATEGDCGTSGIVGTGCMDSYQVLTILPSVPENAGSTVLRPNITGQTKELISLSSLDLSKIPSKSYFTGTDAAGLEAIRRRWSHSTEIFSVSNATCTTLTMCSEGGRAFRAHTLIDDYGGGVAVRFYDDLMYLFSDDHTIAAKTPALAAMLAYGLDLYHTIYDGPSGTTRRWGTGAHQHPGKFVGPVLLAALDGDTTRISNLQSAASHLNDHFMMGPAELAQANAGVTTPVWGDNRRGEFGTAKAYHGAYWKELFKNQYYDDASLASPAERETKRTQHDPYDYIDGPPGSPLTSYGQMALGVQRAMSAVMRIVPGVCDIVNYPNLITYADRVNDFGRHTSPDPCVTPDSRENFTTCDPYGDTGCTYYGVTWGPVDKNDWNSTCITTVTAPYTQAGRFLAKHGTSVGVAYPIAQVEDNWSTIAEETGCSGGTPGTTKIRYRLSGSFVKSAED